MKFYVLNAILAASAVQGYLIPPKTQKIDWRLEQKRQIVGTITSLLGMSLTVQVKTTSHMNRQRRSSLWRMG